MLIVDEKTVEFAAEAQNRAVTQNALRTSSTSSDTSLPPSEAHEKDSQPPPPYQQPVSPSTSASPTITSSTHARTNYLEIVERHRAVKGSWEIDSSLIIPASVLQNQKWDLDDGPRPNLNLVSRGGSITGEVTLTGPSEEVVTIRAESVHGNLKLKFFNNTGQRMQITCSSRQGGASLFLPSNFKGNINCSTRHGKVNFSDRVSENLTRFSTVLGKHLAFLSPDAIPSGPEGAIAFENAPDSLVVTVVHGNVKICYVEEASADGCEESSGRNKERRARRGLFRKMFS